MARTKSSNKFDFRILFDMNSFVDFSYIFHCRLTQSTNQKDVIGRPPSIGTEGFTSSLKIDIIRTL